MANYSATVTSPRPADEVFDYLSDFSHTSEWDPSISSAELTSGSPDQVGARYHLVQSAAGSEVEIDYETVELDRPRVIRLRGSNDAAISDDTITVTPRDGGGCEVRYEAEITLKGARKLAEPLMGLFMQHIGHKAKSGLEEKLS